ncbi:hypothetical protein Pint_24737 [Pistacia integerrima]|uniref:Uncharacterized protein n=1 Tax=Pistacia integerrima TaxID=434235 RepID=A0ACC0YEM8_9ROSI|nr:hypothetical protein Pint_24737 [Pistacia integerrima]
MEEKSEVYVPRVKLGTQGLEVSKLGFGCGGLSGILNAPLSHEAGCSIVREAFSRGITFFDTADVYGENHDNEYMVGKKVPDIMNRFRICSNPTPTMTHVPKRIQERENERDLGIGLVAYSPLGHGFFGGKAVVESLPTESLLAAHPRFMGENLEKNKLLYSRFANLAAKHACTPAQLALAWLFHQGDDIVPIPGTTKLKNLDSNIGALAVKLTEEDLKEISDAVPIDKVSGQRDMDVMANYSWKFADTPSK